MVKPAVFILWWIVFSICAPFSFAQEKTPPPHPQRVAPQGYPVVLGDQILFYLKENVKGYSAEERAKTISERVKGIAEDPGIRISAVATSTFDLPITVITAGDKMLMPLFDQDALGEGRTREELSKEYAEKLRMAMGKYRKDRNRESIIYGVIYTLIATLALIAILVFIRKFYRKIAQGILALVTARVSSIHIQSFQIVQADRIKAVIMGAMKVVRLLVVLVVLYAYLQLVLGFFPWTHSIASEILVYLISPLTTIGMAIAANIPNLVFMVILVLIARYILKLMKYFFLAIENGTVGFSGFFPEWAKVTYKILSYLVIGFFIVVAYPYIPGSDSQAFKGVSIFVGVLFSLGSQSAVSNMIAGFALTYRRAFKIGDRVKIADFTGDVIETRLQVTILRTIKNEEIVVPNAMIMNGHVINYSAEGKERGLILHTTVTIGYDAPWRRVHELLLQAAELTEGVLREPAPFILQKSLDDFYVTYELNVYTDQPQRMSQTYSLLHQNIQDSFNKGGVEIMSPHYTQLRDGNKVTIPASYLPQDYVPGGLRIQQTETQKETMP
ncbi:MAG: mechanosensitive ion channel family protein [Deltaproteobacteria bacterium]|nr:mechanosensitive ion channel family protein [Deltaproteobacteria bacterium]